MWHFTKHLSAANATEQAKLIGIGGRVITCMTGFKILTYISSN